MDSVINRLFYYEFQSNETKEQQSKPYQMICECLKDPDESKQKKVLDGLRRFMTEAAGDRAEYYTEGFCTGAKLMIEVLTAI